MKFRVAAPLSLLFLTAMAASSLAEMPTQKPGLWKMTVTGARMPGGARSFEMCEDAAFIAAARASAASHLKKDCTSNSSLRKVGDTWIADSECTLSGMHIVSHSVTTVHGDEWFHTDATSTIDSSKGAKKTDTMTMDNKWMGACKAGQKVGVPVTG